MAAWGIQSALKRQRKDKNFQNFIKREFNMPQTSEHSRKTDIKIYIIKE